MVRKMSGLRCKAVSLQYIRKRRSRWEEDQLFLLKILLERQNLNLPSRAVRAK